MSWLSEYSPLLVFYALEALFVACTVLLYVQVRQMPRTSPYHYALASLGGLFCGLAVMYLFSFAPFFLPIQGEWMLGTLPVGFLGAPFVIWFCMVRFRKLSLGS
jgi:hypothetical protein